MKITSADNTTVWGEVVGVHPMLPCVVKTNGKHYNDLQPGMFVTSYSGCDVRQVVKRGFVGTGIVIGVQKHPHIHGDIKHIVTVLWNFDNPPAMSYLP